MNPDEGGFDHEDYTLYLLARASELASAEFHAELAALGVPVPVWRVLAVLSGGESSVGRLASACLIKQPTMTKLLDRMATEGLVERRRGEGDGRAVRVALTEAGRARAAALIPLARAHEARLLSEAPEGDAAALRRALKAFIAHREGAGGQGPGGDLPSRRAAEGGRRPPDEAQHDRDPSRRRRALP